jgi:two-component system sensor histidine kinase UhpB
MLKRSENAMRKYADRLRQVSRRVVQVQEQERQHLARELHDEIGQVLSAIRVNLGGNLEAGNRTTKSDTEESISIVDKAIQQVRDLALDLRPSMLDDLGLIATLRWTAERQAKRAKFLLDFAAEATGDRLPADLNIACYRVAQESLTNIVRHAHAKHVSLAIRHRVDEIELVVCDDGMGFDANEVQQGIECGASFGVRGMRERVELLGGTFAVTSSLGNGTRIHAHLPIECAQMVIA